MLECCALVERTLAFSIDAKCAAFACALINFRSIFIPTLSQVGAGYIGRFVIPVDATLLSGQLIRGGYPLTTADGVAVVDSNQLMTRVQVSVQYRSVQMVRAVHSILDTAEAHQRLCLAVLLFPQRQLVLPWNNTGSSNS